MEFRYLPLQDATTQIRLLTFRCAEEDSDDLDVILSVWPLAEAPQYTAISYTWGDTTNPRTVQVNGYRFEVREKCWHALIQCREVKIRAHVWIDSICIDQDNAAEKNEQVAMMASVYAQAAEVLISIPDFQNNEPNNVAQDPFIDSAMTIQNQLSIYRTTLPAPSADEESAKRQTVLSYGIKYFANKKPFVCEAIRKISGAEYWTRLWIIQELVMANRAYLVYHGHIIDLEVVDILVRIYNGLQMDIRADEDFGALGRLLAVVFADIRGKLPLNSVMVRFRNARCSDARDRFYGTMSFIDWYGKPPPKVDYSLSKAELVVSLMSYHDDNSGAHWFIQVLVDTFKLTVNDLEQLNWCALSDDIRSILNARFDVGVPGGIPLASDAVKDLTTRTLNPEEQENLLRKSELIGRQHYPIIPEYRRSGINLYEDVGTMPCKGCNHVGWISQPRDTAQHYVQPGDILFSGLNDHVPAIGMVLRLWPEGVYAVVDLAALLSVDDFCSMCLCSAYKPEEQALKSYITYTAFDLFILVCRVRDIVVLTEACHDRGSHSMIGHIRPQHELDGSNLIVAYQSPSQRGCT